MYALGFRGFIFAVVFLISTLLVLLAYLTSGVYTTSDLPGQTYDMRTLYAYFALLLIFFVGSLAVKNHGFLYHFCFVGMLCFYGGIFAIYLAGGQYVRLARYSYELQPVSAKEYFGPSTYEQFSSEFPFPMLQGLFIASTVMVFLGTMLYAKRNKNEKKTMKIVL